MFSHYYYYWSLVYLLNLKSCSLWNLFVYQSLSLCLYFFQEGSSFDLYSDVICLSFFLNLYFAVFIKSIFCLSKLCFLSYFFIRICPESMSNDIDLYMICVNEAVKIVILENGLKFLLKYSDFARNSKRVKIFL